MTRLAESDDLTGEIGVDVVGSYSPNGKMVVVVLRKGNLLQNTNDFSIVLFELGKDDSPKHDNLLTMSSSSNRDAIKHVKWLNDNETIAFLGENRGEMPQVYTLNVRTLRLEKITNHPTGLSSYDISSNGERIVFTTDRPVRQLKQMEKVKRNGVVINGGNLFEFCPTDCVSPRGEEDLYFQHREQQPVRAAVGDTDVILRGSDHVSISPDGRFAIVVGWAREFPSYWADYRDKSVHDAVSEVRSAHSMVRLKRYLLLDMTQQSVRPLLDTPMVHFDPVAWAPDGRSLFIRGTYLPLEEEDSPELRAREIEKYDVEVELPERRYSRITREEWPRQSDVNTTLRVISEEDLNTPPRLKVFGIKSPWDVSVFDLNPRFAELNFGRVEAIEWDAKDGYKCHGGLYLPPDYETGKRYPLVIQTHGFDPHAFLIDGAFASAAAAQPLAANEIVVLQLGGPDDIAKDTLTEREGPREMAAIEGAIDYLDSQGLIIRSRVGIVGFSRTVYHVDYTLTHSRYRFGAAVLVDGIDGGFFQYLAFGLADSASLNGGPPFGKTLKRWIRNAPTFHLDKVQVPVRLVALGCGSGILAEWEWYAGLKQIGKPVDFIYLPDATHVIVKPWERMAAQEGLVDWFRFWLKGEEDRDPDKAEQYVRWRELRKLQQQSAGKTQVTPAN
jgi:dipeptidyl aminopeptidase/acylaminoacyl peptidase